MPAFKDITGQQFARLTVISIHQRGTKGGTEWNCLCSCGNTLIAKVGALTSGNTKSCGCLRKDVLIDRNTSHSLSDLPEYSVWKDMKKRCYNKNNKRYKNYRKKGIIVDDEFINDFEAWLEHVGPRPNDGQRWSIGRVDNTKGYVRDNMEWQLDSQQAKAHQRQENNTSGVTGISVRKFKDGTIRAYVAGLRVDGLKYSKEFTVSAHGDLAAYTKALNYRAYLLETYGKDFHESHGK